MVTDNSSCNQSATAGSCAMVRTKQVRQIYERIKTKMSATRKRKNGTQQSGRSENCANRNGEKIGTLQSEFYSCLKSWLAPRVKTVLESDLNAVQSLMDDFESDIMNLEKAENDEDREDILFYTSCCECIIEECRDKFPL